MNNDFNKYKRRDYSQLRKDYDSLRRISTDPLDVTPEQLNDPVFGDYYKQYVDTINKLKERENSLLRNAAVAQDTAIANAEENIATLTAENERRAGELRQGREELEALARQRARAMGGMPGSAYEEIQARSERELLKALANMSADYTSRLASIERDLANRINALESDLMDKLAQIEADKTMTLRERDKAINQLKLEMMRRAEEEARAAQARAAAERARLAEMAFYNDLVQQARQQTQQQTQQQGEVKGATDSRPTQPQERYSVTIGADRGGSAGSAKRIKERWELPEDTTWGPAVNEMARQWLESSELHRPSIFAGSPGGNMDLSSNSSFSIPIRQAPPSPGLQLPRYYWSLEQPPLGARSPQLGPLSTLELSNEGGTPWGGDEHNKWLRDFVSWAGSLFKK